MEYIGVGCWISELYPSDVVRVSGCENEMCCDKEKELMILYGGG